MNDYLKANKLAKVYASQVGTDGWILLDTLLAPDTPDWMKTLPAVATLRKIWEQQFEPREHGGQWRDEPALPAAQLINSPYDQEARYGEKRSTLWVGYKTHFSQTCDEEAPQLITHVETTKAGINDDRVLPTIHKSLATRNLLPGQHIVDAGYVNAENLVQSQTHYEVDVLGPVRQNYWWQVDTGYELTQFTVDWSNQLATCPQGKTSSSWTPSQDKQGKSVVRVRFSQTDWKACLQRAACTGTTRRTLTLRPQDQMQALVAARLREKTNAFQEDYQKRAGIEGVHSQAVQCMGLRRSRYMGLAKTHLGNIAIATAINIIQLTRWLRGEPPAQTRTSVFKQVMRQGT